MSDKPAAGRSLFVADLHLTDERPQDAGRFFHLLEHVAPDTDALYILGDLFEYWVGDDDLDSLVVRETALRLKTLSQSGTRIYFMHGNRDFLLAQRYASESAMILLADPVVINLYGMPTLLTHGDTLCTDDVAYQRYRKWVRLPVARKLILALPLQFRQRLAVKARTSSEQAKSGKPHAIMDVNQQAVAHMFQQYGVIRMIHGHTHRPARHELTLGGKTCERWVLPDWYGKGGYLACTEAGCALKSV